MKRHQALFPLSRFHHKGLVLAQLLKRDVPPYKGLPASREEIIEYATKFFQNGLQSHLLTEEKVLFPTIAGYEAEIDQLVLELSAEHQEIISGFTSLSVAETLDSELDKLGKLLERHIRKEERKLFQLIQEKLSNDQLDALGESLR